MKLAGAEQKQLCTALLSAFPTRASLEQMVRFGLNQNLAAIAEGANLAEGVSQLVSWAEAHGQLQALIAAACAENPTNPDLQAVKDLRDWAQLDAWDPWHQPVACPYPGMAPFSEAEARSLLRAPGGNRHALAAFAGAAPGDGDRPLGVREVFSGGSRAAGATGQEQLLAAATLAGAEHAAWGSA